MKTNVKESIVIDIPFDRKEKLLGFILDMSRWQEWSPWTCLDPDVKVECSRKTGKYYHRMEWQGAITGEGSTTITQLREDGADYDLQFLKPFKSQAKTAFYLTPHNQGQSVKVTWIMLGTLPFFLFFMKKLIEVGVSKDYQRGLKRMKFLTETGKIPAQLEFVDSPQEAPGFEFCGLESKKVPFTELGSTMERDFTRIQTTLNSFSKKDGGSFQIKDGYSFYPKVDLVKDLFDYTSGHSYAGELPQPVKEAGLITQSIPSHRAIKVTLTGSYMFLDDAWTGIMMHQRALKLKPDKRVAPYEKYLVMGKNPDRFVTEVYFPVK